MSAEQKAIVDDAKDHSRVKQRAQGEPTPMVNLQVYPPQVPPPPRKTTPNPALYAPVNTNSIGIPPQMFLQPDVALQNQYYPYSLVPNNIPVLKNYQINVTGPVAEHDKLNAIYEDAIPSKYKNLSFNTLNERISLLNYLRSVLIRHSDGEDISLLGSGENSLLRYIKFIELNPYNVEKLKANPYRGLPRGLLIYRSCYPIRFDRIDHVAQCAEKSMGINIRIYGMTLEEYNIKNNKLANFKDYDLWREIAYYEYVRERIVRKKICPNFVQMFCYFISEKSGIDFKKLASIKDKEIKSVFSLDRNISGESKALSASDYTGQALVAVTEAPTYNLLDWTSKTYTTTGIVNKMINTGYHDKEVWRSVIFQLFSGLYAMQLHKIYFENFTLLDNVYIKDVTLSENVTKFWKYLIDDVEFYIPNHGYICLIDSNYKDLEKSTATLINTTSSLYKMGGEIFNTDNNDKCFQQFINATDPTIFNGTFLAVGGVKPDPEILTLLHAMHEEAKSDTDKDISYYLKTYFTEYLNNRIGTLLRTDEITQVVKTGMREHRPGQMIVREIQNDMYEFVEFVARSDSGEAIIYTRDENQNIIMTPYSYDSLYPYQGSIQQKFKVNEADLNEDNMLDIYSIKK